MQIQIPDIRALSSVNLLLCECDKANALKKPARA
jgi:hypothetical protein